MKFHSVFSAQFEVPPLSLGDLFVSLPSSATAERIGGSMALAPKNARHWSQWTAAAGQLPDTPFAAAWLLLQARWLGAQQTVLHEASAHGSQAAARHTALAETLDPAQPAGAWLATLDQKRRQAAEAPGTDTPESSPSFLWLRAETVAPALQAPLHLWLNAASDAPRLRADAAAGLLDAASIEQLLAAIADTAADLLCRPDAPLGDIRTLPEADREQQLIAWNTPPAPLNRQLNVAQMFSRQAAATPDAPALAEGDT